MARIYKDRVGEVTTTQGVGTVTLGGQLTGYQTFAGVAAVGDTFDYAMFAVDGNGVPTGDWETGTGTFANGNKINRAVQESSNNNQAVNFGAGNKNIILTENAASIAALGGGSGPFAAVVFDEDYNTHAITILQQLNIASVTRVAAGRYVIMFANAFPRDVGFLVPTLAARLGAYQNSQNRGIWLSRNTDQLNGLGVTTQGVSVETDGDDGRVYIKIDAFG